MAANTELVKVDTVEKSTWAAILALVDDATALATLATNAEALTALAENVEALTELATNADALLALIEDDSDSGT